MVGVSLGSASFSLLADNAQLLSAFVQSQAAAQNASAAIASAVRQQAAVAQQSNAVMAAAYQQGANAATAAAQAQLRAAAQAQQALQQMTQGAGAATGSFGSLLKGGVALGAGLAGVSVGLNLVREGMSAAYDATVALSNANFALTKAYGGSAEALAKYAEAQSKSTEFSKASIEQGLAITSALQKEGGFTDDQQKQLLTRAQDLAAAYGTDLPSALKALEGAFKGRAGALSQYGALINEEVIKERGLNDQQRANYANLSEATKLQAGLNVAMQLTANDAGAAEEHLKTLGGATANLEKASGSLAAVLGKAFEPGLVNLENSLAKGIQDITDWFAKVEKLQAEHDAAVRAAGGTGFIPPFEPPGLVMPTPDFLRPRSAGLPADTRAADEGVHENPSDIANTRNAAILALEKERERNRIEGEQAIASLHAAHDARIADIADQKTALERKRDAEVKAAEESKQTQLDSIRDQAQAARLAAEAELGRLRDEETAKKKIVEDEKQATVDRIAAEKQAYDDDAAERIRQAEIVRDRLLQSVEAQKQGALDALAAEKRIRDDARVVEDRQLQDAAQTETRRIDDVHTAAVRALEDETKVVERHKEAQIRALDDEAKAAQKKHDASIRHLDDEGTAAQKAHDTRLRNLDDEDAAAQKSHDTQLRSLDDQAKAEDRLHRQNVQNISDEAKRRADAIDVQIKAIDDLQKKTQDADKIAQLQQGVTAARAALGQATGTGTPDQIAAARGDLTTALRVGNEVSIANARDRLQQLAGQGAAAIKKAADDLAAAEKALLDEQTKEVQDASKAQLQIQKDGIATQEEVDKRAEDVRNQQRKDDLDAAKQAADDALKIVKDEVAQEKQAADDKLKKVKDNLVQEKQAADDKLKKTKDTIDQEKRAVDDQVKHDLDAIADRKRAEQDQHDAAVKNAHDVAEQAKRAVDDRRKAEGEQDQDRRTQIERTAKAEQDAIKATYDDEATGAIPAIRRAQHAADEGYAAQTKAAEENARASIAAIDDLYNNHEHGLIPLAEQAAAATALSFQNQTHAVEEESGKKIAAIKSVYTNDAGTGLIDQLEAARIATDAALKEDTRRWTEWKDGLVGENGVVKKTFEDAQAQFDAFIKHITENKGTVTVDSSGFDPNKAGPGDSGTRFGPPAPGGAGSSAGVPDPYRVTFPFDAPYNGPYAGGAAWAGGPSRHRGVDLALPGPDNGRGTAYGAFQAGTVEALIPESQDPAGGNGILIRTNDGLYNYYGHNDSFLVGQGDHVDVGQRIGTLGRSGLDEGMQTHLHYEVRRGINGDPVGSTIDPVPYMSGGGMPSGGQTFSFTLFGHRFTVTLPFGGTGDVGRAIAAALALDGLPADWLVPMEQIAAAESGERRGDGSVVIGSGDARAVNPETVGSEHASGLMQMLPSTFEGHRLKLLPDDIFNSVANAASAARYIKDAYGDPRNTDYFSSGSFDWRGVDGYRNGGWISPNSLIMDGATMTPYAHTEGLPERVLSPEQSAAWASGHSSGPSVVEGDIYVNGIGLDEVAAEIERRQHRRQLLRGGRR